MPGLMPPEKPYIFIAVFPMPSGSGRGRPGAREGRPDPLKTLSRISGCITNANTVVTLDPLGENSAQVLEHNSWQFLKVRHYLKTLLKLINGRDSQRPYAAEIDYQFT